MNNFAQWLAQTQVSVAIQSHLWVIPAVQSVHIVAIGIVMGSVFMIDLRIWGFTGRDRTLQQTVRRFAPWLWGALAVLLVTGVVMITGEPVRELMSLSFWLKMFQLAVGIILAVAFQGALRRNEDRDVSKSLAVRVLAVLTLLVWFSIIVLGRLIAYDHVWGSWSPRPII
jgi:putative copper export protein